MAIGIYIALVVIGILAFAIIKLIQRTSKTSYFGEPSRCNTCGRRTETPDCPFCKPNSKSLR